MMCSSRRGGRRVLHHLLALVIIFIVTAALCSFDKESLSSSVVSNRSVGSSIKNYAYHSNSTLCGVAGSNASCYKNEHLLHPLNVTKSYSFLHISKCGGVSWFQELRKLLPKDKLYLSSPDGHPEEHGLYYQNNLMKRRYNETDYYKLVTFRSPRLHVYSQFRHCSFSDWGRGTIIRNGKGGFPRDSKDVMTNFDHWLDHFINITTNSTSNATTNLDSFGCYHPVNLQSRFLTTNAAKPFIPSMNMNYFRDHWMPYPNYIEVEHNLHDFDWVGLTDFFHESKCVLYHRLVKGSGIKNETITTMITEYLDSTCICSVSSNSTALQQDVKFEHTTTNKRDSMLDVSDEIVNKIDILTHVDQDLYRAALEKFMNDIVSLEFQLGRRVICENVLETASLELAYLGINIKDEVYDKRKS